MFSKYYSEYIPVTMSQSIDDLSYNDNLPDYNFNIPTFPTYDNQKDSQDDGFGGEDPGLSEIDSKAPPQVQYRHTKQPTKQNNSKLTREYIIKYATPYFGTGYELWAAKKYNRALGKPIDCSGWTYRFFNDNFGVNIGATTISQQNYGSEVASLKQAQPGDIVIMHGGGPNKMHVGIYIGNGEMIDSQRATNKSGYSGIAIRPVPERKIKTIRRPNIENTSKAQNGGKLIPKPRYII